MARPKGVPNKNKRGLLGMLKQQYGDDFHPIMKMAKNAVELQSILDGLDGKEIDKLFVGLKMSIDAWDKIAQYTEPKLKAIEVSGEIKTRPILVDLSGGELTKEFESDSDEADN
jgi:hypothetical protein